MTPALPIREQAGPVANEKAFQGGYQRTVSIKSHMLSNLLEVGEGRGKRAEGSLQGWFHSAGARTENAQWVFS